MPTLNHVYLRLVMIIFLGGYDRWGKAAGRYETVLYNYVHNMVILRHGFYLHWGIFTQLPRRSSMTGIRLLLIDGSSHFATVINSQEITTTPPRAPHASSGTEWFPWTIPALRDFVGAAATDTKQG